MDHVTAIVLTCLVLGFVIWIVGSRWAREEAQREREEEAAQHAFETKRLEFAKVVAREQAHAGFLDPRFRETYAHEHRREILEKWPARIEAIAAWRADPDLVRLKRDVPTAQHVERIWDAELEVFRRAQGLRRADVETWHGRQLKVAGKAIKAGVTLQEYERRTLEEEARATARERVGKKVPTIVRAELAKTVAEWFEVYAHGISETSADHDDPGNVAFTMLTLLLVNSVRPGDGADTEQLTAAVMKLPRETRQTLLAYVTPEDEHAKRALTGFLDQCFERAITTYGSGLEGDHYRTDFLEALAVWRDEYRANISSARSSDALLQALACD